MKTTLLAAAAALVLSAGSAFAGMQPYGTPSATVSGVAAPVATGADALPAHTGHDLAMTAKPQSGAVGRSRGLQLAGAGETVTQRS